MPKADSDEQNVQTNVRLPADLYAMLQDTAKRERRSQSGIIQAALEEYFRDNGETDLPDELVQAVKEYLERHR